MTSSARVQDVGFDEEDIVVAKSTNAADARFDQIIGCIEDIIMEPRFQETQDDFMNKNYRHFEDSDENKLIYTTVHKEYINLIEKYIENQLIRRIDNFSMEDFMSNLMSRKDELDGEIFEILLTFEDFLEFKQLMLNYKASKEGKAIDLSLGMCIQSLSFDSNGSNRNSNRYNNNQNTANNNSNRRSTGGKSNTPLLDKTQVDPMDSDHE